MDSDTCATTNALRSQARRGEVEPPLSSLIAAITSGRDARSAGTRPNTSTANTESASVNANMGAPPSTCTQTGKSLTGAKLISILPVNGTTARAANPPSNASSVHSTSSSRTRRARVTPSACRIAISRRRTAPRAKSRLATLAQAISSTTATTPISRNTTGASMAPPPSRHTGTSSARG